MLSLTVTNVLYSPENHCFELPCGFHHFECLLTYILSDVNLLQNDNQLVIIFSMEIHVWWTYLEIIVIKIGMMITYSI